MNGRRQRIKLAGGLAAVVVAGLVVGGVLAARSDQKSGGQGPVLDVPQDAVASDGGVTLRLIAAAFSSTGTFLHIYAEASEVDLGDGVTAVRAAIPADGWGAGLAGDGPAAVALSGSGPALARLDPVVADGPTTISVTVLELLTSDERLVRLEGDWVLDLHLPENLGRALRSERLAGSPAAESGGVTMRATGGRRSTSETMVTVEVDPPGATPLGEPRLIAGKKSFRGVLIDEQDDGRLLTYAFPPTPFGSEVRVEFEAFRLRPPGGTSETRFDLGQAMAGAGVTGKHLEVVRLFPGELHAVSGEAIPVTSITFHSLPNASIGPITAIRIVLGTNYDVYTTQFTLITATGNEARLISRNDIYNRDLTGTVRPGHHELDFEVNKQDVSGVVALLLGGGPTDLVRGLWAMQLTVDDSVD